MVLEVISMTYARMEIRIFLHVIALFARASHKNAPQSPWPGTRALAGRAKRDERRRRERTLRWFAWARHSDWSLRVYGYPFVSTAKRAGTAPILASDNAESLAAVTLDYHAADASLIPFRLLCRDEWIKYAVQRVGLIPGPESSTGDDIASEP